MKNYLFYVGIDISKIKLDAVVISSENPSISEHFLVDNNSIGVKEIITILLNPNYALETYSKLKKKLIQVKHSFVVKIQASIQREGVAKVAPSNFGDFLWETSGLQKHLTTLQKTPKLLGLPCEDRRLFYE